MDSGVFLQGVEFVDIRQNTIQCTIGIKVVPYLGVVNSRETSQCVSSLHTHEQDIVV